MLAQPAQPQFAQRGEAVRGKEAAQRSLCGIGSDHVGSGDAGTQLLGSDVDESDFIGGRDHSVGNGLPLSNPRECLLRVIQTVDVLHVE